MKNKFKNPIDNVLWVENSMIEANDYNPNKVAPPEMKLLYLSIKNDWYTQPIVTYFDKEKQKYIVVDWFHRYRIWTEKKDIRERNWWKLPIVVIDKDIKDRMASTIRHNRARWKHWVLPMSEIIADLYKKWWDDEKIAIELWMQLDEVLRLKQNSWLPEIFKKEDYSLCWDIFL